jgi:hypothetical protein
LKFIFSIVVEKPFPVQAKIFVEEVKLNSKVQVKYVNNGKGIHIHIVSTENNKNHKSDGFQEIYFIGAIAHYHHRFIFDLVDETI